MYDIKWLKENTDVFDAAMKKRGITSISKQVIKLYDEYVDLITKLQNLQNERNILSKNIGLKKIVFLGIPIYHLAVKKILVKNFPGKC